MLDNGPMTTAKKKIGILISGRGSNMAALIEAARTPDYPAEIAIVISNKASAAGLERAMAAGIETRVIDHKGFASREAFDDAVHAALVAAGVELVALAGFMRIQSAGFVDRWLGRQLNIHPSLLPSFKGLHPHKQALDAGVRITGATVHYVTHELDGGPIVAQAAVPLLAGDTVEALETRILAVEHRLYPHAVRLVASGAARLSEGRVRILPADSVTPDNVSLFSPSA
jgi:phosphoribosylglycinamide formyltransferase 1